ncbi:MAG: hypothetical protein IBX68_01995 [Dehalococcoidia bacterium]|nr:hypothetical protein [Dehalococcoidia bacterium]
MPHPRQRHIPLSVAHRLEMDRRKREYEDRTGDCGDWGKFLQTVTLAGLAALGVYAEGKVSRLGLNAWRVSCPCGSSFPVQTPNPPPWRLAQTTCPSCGGDIVVDFSRPLQDPRQRRIPSEYSGFCQFCQQPINPSFSRENVNQVRYIECGRCGRVPGI